MQGLLCTGTSRHFNVPTTDVPLRHLATLLPALNHALREARLPTTHGRPPTHLQPHATCQRMQPHASRRQSNGPRLQPNPPLCAQALLPAAAAAYPSVAAAGAARLRVLDGFLVRYQAPAYQSKALPHLCLCSSVRFCGVHGPQDCVWLGRGPRLMSRGELTGVRLRVLGGARLTRLQAGERAGVHVLTQRTYYECLRACLPCLQAGKQAGLPTHCDQSLLSYTIALNEPTEYDGCTLPWLPRPEAPH